MINSEDQDLIREFLVESHENLTRLDQELVELEQRPTDGALLASIFRTIHTIKGTSGFLGFSALEAITHHAENILSQLRSGEKQLSAHIVTLVLKTVDAVRKILASVESTFGEGTERFESLVAELEVCASGSGESPAASDAAPREQVAEPPAATNETTEPHAKESAMKEVPVKDNPIREVAQKDAAPKEAAPKEAAPKEADAPTGDSHPKEGEPVAKDGDKPPQVVDSTIRVGVGLLDNLMDLVGELVLTRNQILQYNSQREDAALNAASQRLNLITTELQGGVMKTRMQPIGVVWNKLPRVVRDMSVMLGKQIQLEMEGADTELDKTIIEAIKDPLVHLIRNCCDHGIERPEVRVARGKPATGKLTLKAYHEGGQVNIEIIDNGAGIDIARVKQKAVEKGLLRPEQTEGLSEREALNLVFLPGFSTAAIVTNVSGRGVGMDVVKSNIEKIGGIVDVSTRANEGTTFKLKIPLTLAIIPGLVVVTGGERFVIPQVSLLELIRLEAKAAGRQIELVHGTPVYRRRGSLLPIVYLSEVLGLKAAEGSEAVNIVVLQGEDRQFGIVVDGIQDTQEIVVKPLGKQLKGLSTYAGATIMGDGKVALILDVVGIGQRSGVLTASGEQGMSAAESRSAGMDNVQRLLLFRSGSFERLAVPLSLVARLEEFRQTSIEQAGGRRVVQYRDCILPLISLAEALDPCAASLAEPPDPIQAIVFSDRERSVGIVVDQIVDIVEEAVTIRQQSTRQGLLGSAVIGKKVVDFVDLQAILKSTDIWQDASNTNTPATVLLAEASRFSRGLLRASLEMAGHNVIEAASTAEALRVLDQRHADVLVAAMDLPPGGGYSLLSAVRQRPSLSRIPAIALVDSNGADVQAPAGGPDFEDRHEKSDWQSMVQSVQRLASAIDASDAYGAELAEVK